MIFNRERRKPGTPTGGQFAATSREEAATGLASAQPPLTGITAVRPLHINATALMGFDMAWAAYNKATAEQDQQDQPNNGR